MAEEITTTKESRPMSANDPLRCQKNYKTQYNNPKKKYLSEKENEQLKKLTKKSPVDNLLNSPYRNEKKDYIPNDKKTTTKNLLSEIKPTKRKTRLEKIQLSANTLGNKKKAIKLGTIDANKGTNKEKIIINVNNNQRNKLEINCGGITNKQSTNGVLIQDNYKEKEKLTNVKKNDFFKNKNSKSIEKINITINQKKKTQEENNKKVKKIEEIKNYIKNNINKSINVNESINKEKKEIKNNKENNNKKNNNYIEVNTKNSNDNKTVKFNKEISIINILKESNDSNDTQNNNNNNSIKEERDNTKDTSNNINIENSSIEVKFISNININNQNDIYFYDENNKFNNYEIVKNSANSNKNLSEIPEEINTNFSKSKLEPFQDVSNINKKESNSDKNCVLIQSISNNIETDKYLHKTINHKDISVYLGELIYEGSYCSIYKGLNLTSGEIICVKRYYKNDLDEIKSEIDLFELMKEREPKNNMNIIKYYGYKYEDETYFLFLEYVSDDNLKKIIKLYGGKLNEKLIKIYTKQILKALLFLHNELKVAHRDIKCSNILLDKNGIIKLIDFGCSGIIEKQNKENEKNKDKNNNDKNKPFKGFKGSLLWCAPEVIIDEYYGTKCDIWSLGCSIIEMGGLEPWNGTLNNLYQYKNIVGKSKELPEIPNQFSNELKDFLLHCLVKDPDKRTDANFLLNHTFIKDG